MRTRLDPPGSPGAAAAIGRSLRPILLATSVVLGGCGLLGYNCTTQCGTSIGFLNTTDQAVDVVWGDERYVVSPAVRLEPGQRDSYTFSTPSRGDLRTLFITVRATNTFGTAIFCQRMSWKEYSDRESGTIEIVRGDLRC